MECYNRKKKFYFSPNNLSKKEVTTETIKLNSNAENQPLTLKPGTISDAHFTMRILIKKRNNPNVKMVIGIVRIINMGFTKLFNSPRTTATITAVKVLFTLTPCNKKEAIRTATEVIKVFERNLPMSF
jgi:hypothetical protein